MNIRAVGLAALLFGVACFADDTERAKLMGTWEIQNGTYQGSKVIWLIESKGEALHVTHLQGDRKIVDFECSIDGRECATKESGHSARVSLWFNGSKLVELETKGSDVVKHRFGIYGGGDEMDLEVIPVASESKAETVHFKRVKAPSNK